jgi:hypothetical protein
VKTLTTAIHITSALAVKERYHDAVMLLLRQRAQDLQNIEDQVVQIRNLALAGAALTPDRIDLILARVNQLMADPAFAAYRDTLELMERELIRARDSAAGATGTIEVLRDHFSKQINDQIAEYQLLILEYAQFVTDKDLENTITPGSRAILRSRLVPSDVFIFDNALGGRGSMLRTLFGLPSPVQ